MDTSPAASPAGCLERGGGVSREARVSTGGFWVEGPAVVMGMVVPALLIADHLQRLT